MGDVLKSIEHSGDGSPLVSLRDRCCRQRQVLTTGLEQIYTSLGVHHLHQCHDAYAQWALSRRGCWTLECPNLTLLRYRGKTDN